MRSLCSASVPTIGAHQVVPAFAFPASRAEYKK